MFYVAGPRLGAGIDGLVKHQPKVARCEPFALFIGAQTFCILEDVEMTLFVVVADAWTLFYSSMDDLFELWNQPRRGVVLGLQTGSLFC